MYYGLLTLSPSTWYLQTRWILSELTNISKPELQDFGLLYKPLKTCFNKGIRECGPATVVVVFEKVKVGWRKALRFGHACFAAPPFTVGT